MAKKSKRSKRDLQGVPIEGYAADRNGADLAKWAPRLGTVEDASGISMDFGGLPVDQNLARADAAARANYQLPVRGNTFRAPAPGEGGLPTDQNLSRINARGAASGTPTPVRQVAALDKALHELDLASQRVRASKGGGVLDGRLARLEKARTTVVRAREAVLAKAQTTDNAWHAREASESAAPGIGRAVDQISKLQARR